MKYSIVILDNFIPFSGNYEFRKINPAQAKELLKNFKFITATNSPSIKVLGLLPNKKPKKVKMDNTLIQIWIKKRKKEIKKEFSIRSHYQVEYIISIAIPHIEKLRKKVHEILGKE